MQGNLAWMQFSVQMGQVTVPTPVTFTATLDSQTTSVQLTVEPPSLKSLEISPSSVTGGTPRQLSIMLNGQAPPGGINVASASVGQGTFPMGTAITLSVTSGRDAIGSGACSSGGNKVKTCWFTVAATSSVSVAVQ